MRKKITFVQPRVSQTKVWSAKVEVESKNLSIEVSWMEDLEKVMSTG